MKVLCSSVMVSCVILSAARSAASMYCGVLLHLGEGGDHQRQLAAALDDALGVGVEQLEEIALAGHQAAEHVDSSRSGCSYITPSRASARSARPPTGPASRRRSRRCARRRAGPALRTSPGVADSRGTTQGTATEPKSASVDSCDGFSERERAGLRRCRGWNRPAPPRRRLRKARGSHRAPAARRSMRRRSHSVPAGASCAAGCSRSAGRRAGPRGRSARHKRSNTFCVAAVKLTQSPSPARNMPEGET